MMRRRDFITLLGGAAAWPLAAFAERLSNFVKPFHRRRKLKAE